MTLQIGPARIGWIIAGWMLNLTHPGWNAPDKPAMPALPVPSMTITEMCERWCPRGKQLEYTSDPYGTDPAGSLGNEMHLPVERLVGVNPAG